MASDSAARHKRKHDAGHNAPQPRSQGPSTAQPGGMDRVVHERGRLAILSVLAGVDTLTFNELKQMLDITDGNLSIHTRRLEEAGLVAAEKSFVQRVPRTQYRLTDAGRAALDEYLNQMQSLIRRVREG